MSNKFISQCFTKLDMVEEKLMQAYAYEVTTNRGVKYLVRAGSVTHANAVMFGYQLKPLYEGE